MKTYHANVGNWVFVNVIGRSWEPDRMMFAIPGGRVVTKDVLESWAKELKLTVKYTTL